MLLLAGVVPMFTQYVGHAWPVGALGTFMAYLPLVPIGAVTLGLSIQPADATGIRLTAYTFVLLWLALAP